MSYSSGVNCWYANEHNQSNGSRNVGFSICFKSVNATGVAKLFSSQNTGTPSQIDSIALIEPEIVIEDVDKPMVVALEEYLNGELEWRVPEEDKLESDEEWIWIIIQVSRSNQDTLRKPHIFGCANGQGCYTQYRWPRIIQLIHL